MRDYELMLILDPTLDDDALSGASERIQALVTARGGEMTSLDPMGRRRMAYPIKQHRDGY